ncbi:MAG: hypothetical protein IJS94_04780, partial [Clostridia bacterium]|nr:hypothetical protein [Clostridia bacterium]
EEIKKQRDRIYGYMSSKGYKAYKSDTNFVYVKTEKSAKIFDHLYSSGIIIKKFAYGALRITAGSKEETDIFTQAMDRF